MKSISFQVQGSSSEPYNVRFEKDGNNLNIWCDCPAGAKATHCKHWTKVFLKEKQAYVGVTEEELDEVRSWISGSDIEEVWIELERNKEQEKRIKEERKAIQKKLSRVMRD